MAKRKKLEFISSVEITNTPMKKQLFVDDKMIYPSITMTGTAVAVKYVRQMPSLLKLLRFPLAT